MQKSPTIIEGKFNKASIFAADIEEESLRQIKSFLDHEAFADGNIAIMPDVHAGKGAVIGFTSELGSKVIPNVIGVDIGCGVKTWCLGSIAVAYSDLDRFIRGNIPFGKSVRPRQFSSIEPLFETLNAERSATRFLKQLKQICLDQNQDYNRVLCSLGSLGGGNHFIELDRDEDNLTWLTIHSGSRNFGLRIAEHNQNIARKRCGSMAGLEYLEGQEKSDYLEQMKIAQEYAQLNRHIMGHLIIDGYFGQKPQTTRAVESIHNYISFADNIIRKGAISAHRDEPIVIPFNMADGLIIGRGLGNRQWNSSAPHGAGRQLSRTAARKQLSIDEFRSRMEGVWSSCIAKSTIDESPMAYKSTSTIADYLSDTVRIERKLRPIYNFKAED